MRRFQLQGAEAGGGEGGRDEDDERIDGAVGVESVCESYDARKVG